MTETATDQKSAVSSAVSGSDETMSIGMRLRVQRESLGLTAEDVASSLKIPAKKVMAIEAEQWETLPTGPYLKGFLRSYAKALRIDAAQLIAQIDSSLTQSRSPDTILRMPQSFETPLPRPSMDASDWKRGRRMIGFGLALLVLIGLIVWSGTQSFRDLRTRAEDNLVSDTPPASSTALPSVSASGSAVVTESAGASTTPANEPVVVGNTSANALPGSIEGTHNATASDAAAGPNQVPAALPAALSQTDTGPVPGSVPLTLNFSAETWVEIKQADGKILMSRINPANASVSLEVVPPADIQIGNAAGIKLQYRNAPFDLSPYVRENIARLTLK